MVENNDWLFICRYEGDQPCGLPDWAWSCFGYLNGELKIVTSGPTEVEARKRAEKMI